MERPMPGELERRKQPRVETSFLVHCHTERIGKEEIIEARTVNISVNGVCIASGEEVLKRICVPPWGLERLPSESIGMILFLPEPYPNLQVEGKVLYFFRPEGAGKNEVRLGIYFTKISDKDRGILKRFVRDHGGDLGM